VTKLFPNNRFSQRHLLHIGRDTGEPVVAGFVSGAASMMPLKVMRGVGHLDESFFIMSMPTIVKSLTRNSGVAR
jgi:GT2 family glycosyltransferase